MRLAPLPHPRVAVLVGGDSRHHRFTDADVARLADQLGALARAGAGLMMTASRRTPEALRRARDRPGGGRTAASSGTATGDNPYLPMLALADSVVVTADSFNMIGEAAATGVPVLVFEPQGGHPQARRLSSAS